MVDMDALKRLAEAKEQVDTRGVFERIYRGTMPTIVSGSNSNSQIFYKGAVICMKSKPSAIDRDNYIVPVWMT